MEGLRKVCTGYNSDADVNLFGGSVGMHLAQSLMTKFNGDFDKIKEFLEGENSVPGDLSIEGKERIGKTLYNHFSEQPMSLDCAKKVRDVFLENGCPTFNFRGKQYETKEASRGILINFGDVCRSTYFKSLFL